MKRYIRNLKIIYWKTRKQVCNLPCVTCPEYKKCTYFNEQMVLITNEDERKIIKITKKIIKKIVIFLEDKFN